MKCPFSPLLFNIALKILAKALRQDREIEGIQIGKEKVKLDVITYDMILYVKNPKYTHTHTHTKTLLELIKKFSSAKL